MSAVGTHLHDQATWLARGYIQGQRDMLLRLLESRFALSADSRARVATAEPEVIDTWSTRVLDADDLDAVFAE